MIDTMEIYDELKTDLNEAAAHKIAVMMGKIYTDLANTVTREDFHELKVTVLELSEAQKHTEIKVEKLASKVEELAEAQKRTELKVEELAEAQKKTEETMRFGFQRMESLITELGSRWGIRNENTFRNTIRGLLVRAGFTVSRGEYGGREVDVIIRNGEHMLLEITSRMNKKDISDLNASADDYLLRHGIDPKLMVAAVYIPPSVFEAFSQSKRPITIFSDEEE